jgi:hypothetical protein
MNLNDYLIFLKAVVGRCCVLIRLTSSLNGGLVEAILPAWINGLDDQGW